MDAKNKTVKMARVCHLLQRFYILACIACLTLIILAITLPLTNAIDTLSNAETAVVFGTAALTAFICIGLLWNVEELFKILRKNNRRSVSRYVAI